MNDIVFELAEKHPTLTNHPPLLRPLYIHNPKKKAWRVQKIWERGYEG
jgi:hypothetical protein